MSEHNEGDARRRIRSRMMIASGVFLALALVNLVHALSNPRYETVPGIAFVQLTGIGATFGAALVLLVLVLTGFPFVRGEPAKQPTETNKSPHETDAA